MKAPLIFELLKRIEKLENAEKEKYPIGKLEFNVSGVNPKEYIGFGTWVAWGKGKVPVGVDIDDSDFNTVEKTSGSKTHSHSQGVTGGHLLTVDEIPKHNHIIWSANASGSETSANGNVFPDPGSSNKSWGYEMLTLNTGGEKEHTHTNPDTNSSSSVQPSITCYMWKRIA